MTLETVRALSDAELSQVDSWIHDEKKSRAERRKEDAIAKIKALAESAGIKVAIGGVRGRPARITPDAKAAKVQPVKQQ
jgi:hypothetical protein